MPAISSLEVLRREHARLPITTKGPGINLDDLLSALAAELPTDAVLVDTTIRSYDDSLRLMAAADVLVPGCGTFGALLAALHWRGVTLMPPCTARLFPEGGGHAAPNSVRADKSGRFNETAVLEALRAMA